MEYRNLSRRALIKLNNDYDVENQNALKTFLNEHSDEYEMIRPIEKVTEKTDELTEVVSAKFNEFKDKAMDKIDTLFDSTISSVAGGVIEKTAEALITRIGL